MESMDLDAEVERRRNLVLSTCTALGGYEAREIAPGQVEQVYTLGDEALACLKDLKAHIRQDMITNARITLPALAEFNLIENDLVPILKMYAKEPGEIAERFILACVELLVPMTWPLEQPLDAEDEDYDPNMLDRYRRYKLALLQPNILETITRLIRDPLCIPHRDRSERDQNIIRLVFYLYRNLTAIPDVKASTVSSEIQLKMSTMQEMLLIRLHKTEIMELLLAVASNSLLPEGSEWNLTLNEILYNLVKNIHPRDVYEKSEAFQTSADMSRLSQRLSNLLQAENGQKRRKLRDMPSRHSRFGGMYAIKRWDGAIKVTQRQDAAYADLGSILDTGKKENRVGIKRKERDELGSHITYQAPESISCLQSLARTFLRYCFHVFFRSLIRDVEREYQKILEKDYTRMFYNMHWFLTCLEYELALQAAEQEENEKQQSERQNPPSQDTLLIPSRASETLKKLDQALNNSEPSEQIVDQDNADGDEDEDFRFDFDNAASAFDMRTIRVILRRLRLSLDEKRWLEAQVTADCLREMLLLVSKMSSASRAEFRETADYIQSNIYYEQTTLDIFVDMIKTYKAQSKSYLESVVQLTHVGLKLVEQYSKRHQHMFVQKRNNGKKKKPLASEKQGTDNGSDSDSVDEERENLLSVREHEFKFDQFEKKFVTFDVVQVYCSLLDDLENLSPHVCHCITSMFHRIMVKRGVHTVFYKLPVLALFNRILGQMHVLPRTTALRQLEEFILYCTRQFFKRLRERPLLIVEALYKNAHVVERSRRV